MTTDPIKIVRELLTTISNEEKFMSFSSAGENDGSEMKAHLARHIRANEALAALDGIRANYLPLELLPDGIDPKCINEVLEEGNGFWRSCSGCHELNEGQETGHYPFSKVFKCYVGSGCDDCGGIGVIWDNTDYEDMANFINQKDTP